MKVAKILGNTQHRQLAQNTKKCNKKIKGSDDGGGFYCQWQDNSKQQWPWEAIAAAFLLSFLTWLSLVSLKS